MERKTTHGPGPEVQGGGYRSGPKRWTGRGPAPARHIPWPEIFKHHISLIEGHMKMVDMVRKHTVEGSGNWETITGCVERCKTMMYEAKKISSTFVPPPKQREQVPLGVSSASIYPRYSPADHEYGKAAQEFGQSAAVARARGEEVMTGPMEYKLGQARGIKRTTLAGKQEAARERGIGSGSGSDEAKDSLDGERNAKKQKTDKSKNTPAATSESPPDGDNPYFVIDTNPTPVNIPGMKPPSSQHLAPPTSAKRAASPNPPETAEGKKHKKAKKKQDPLEDLSGAVEIRLKEKEEKRKRKGGKKRKRESDESERNVTAADAGAAAGGDEAGGQQEAKAIGGNGEGVDMKPKKKKHKPLAAATSSPASASQEKGAKKRKKGGVGEEAEAEAEGEKEEDEGGPKRKKSKKRKMVDV